MDVDSSGFPFYINSTLFDMEVINDTVLLGDTEVWELYNTTDVAHPFHIHDIQFFVLEYNNNPPPPHMAGRKDVVMLEPGDTVKFITVFDDFADSIIPYMYHCHNLFHEDAGMMGQFLVLEEAWVGVDEWLEDPFETQVKVYPNPVRDILKIRLEHGQGRLTDPVIRNFELVNAMGQRIRQFDIPMGRNEIQLDMGEMPAGMYLLLAKQGESTVGAFRLIKR